MKKRPAQSIDDFTRVTAAMADPNRVRLLAACLERERCVCQLVALIDLSNASISKHLGQLRDAGLLESRREGRWVHYRLPDQPNPMILDAIALVRNYAVDDALIAADRVTLGHIDAIDPNELARMQREGCCPDLSCCPTEATTPTAAHRRGVTT